MSYPLPAAVAAGALVWTVNARRRPAHRSPRVIIPNVVVPDDVVPDDVNPDVVIPDAAMGARAVPHEPAPNQPAPKGSRPDRRALRGARRARRRGLSRAVSRIERSVEYRRSLSELHALASSFQRGLSRSQRERWLAVEEALLAHAERVSHVYYQAGFGDGAAWHARTMQRPAPLESSHEPGRGARASTRRAGARSGCLAALARCLLAMARR
jgi:hypothetical protein